MFRLFVCMLLPAALALSGCSKNKPVAENTTAADSVKTDPREGEWLVDYAEGDMALTYEGMLYRLEGGKLTTIAGAVTTTGGFSWKGDTLEWKVNDNPKSLVKFGYKVEGDKLVLQPAKGNDIIYLKRKAVR